MHCRGRIQMASYPVFFAKRRNSSYDNGLRPVTCPIGSEIRPERDSLIRGHAALMVRAAPPAINAAFKNALLSNAAISARKSIQLCQRSRQAQGSSAVSRRGSRFGGPAAGVLNAARGGCAESKPISRPEPGDATWLRDTSHRSAEAGLLLDRRRLGRSHTR